LQVQLVSPGLKKIQVIKVVRELTHWDLKEAKAWVDAAPNSAMEVEPALAEGVADALRTAGATVEVSGGASAGGDATAGAGAGAAESVPGAAGAARSVADELEELASLRDRGILTDEEFTAAKTRLLGMS
jgi:hypothetical protein